jgi:predicted DCC family thiol-disulfide oxidoreductase YuxK
MNPNISYYNTKKYCPSCHGYVRFLQSLDASYCVECGSKVRLFSTADKKEFLKGLQAAKQSPRKTGTDQKRVS